ncbi:MAG: DUF7901 domain-containing protein [Planctomycetota bacterium]|jgi:hypothetical protein
MKMLNLRLLIICSIALSMASSVALGDWDEGDGHKMHYPQLPKLGGLDVAFNSAYIGLGRLADDWECTETGPVTDIHFWVSWERDDVDQIDGFSVRIWSDNPSGQHGYSEPNELLWERNFFAGEFAVRDMPDDWQGWFDPFSGMIWPIDHIRWQQINVVEIDAPFDQKEGEIYWLEIYMWGAPSCGWKQSGEPQFRDDAVAWDSAYWMELTDPCTGESLDLAFVITTDLVDFGDAPDPNYPTLLANDGARHVIGGPFFCTADGADAPDPEPDGQPDPWATGDDLDADGDDEDGVVFPILVQGQPDFISLNICGAAPFARVQIWIDWDGSESWEAGEQVFNGILGNGAHSIPVTAPAGSVLGLTFARCRITTVVSLLPTGQASDGEVEDHMVEIEQEPTCWDNITQCGGQSSGDSTCDGRIDLGDLFALKMHFGQAAPWTPPECCSDYNHDNSVNLGDLFILKRYFGTGPYLPATGNQNCP